MPERSLSDHVSAFPGCSVAVVGDLMLDRYIWGRASRISQEAPVPVVQVQRESIVPGGAANVVRNILSLGAQARSFGIIGVDRHGTRLCAALQEAGADVAGIVRTSTRPTTVKTRVLAGSQQVVRIDREDTSAVPPGLLRRLQRDVVACINSGQVQAVILEDYAKGVLTEQVVGAVVAAGRESGVAVALDPHPSHPYRVNGLRLMTPNRAEAFALAGVYYEPGRLPLAEDRALLAVGRKLQMEWAAELLLVTLGPAGMALFPGSAPPLHIPTQARQVFDVSGAGDTVMATCVLSLLAGADPEQAAHIANHAAGIVVAEVGTAAVRADELHRDVSGRHE